MNDPFNIPAAPGFDDPLEMLQACHGRITAQCDTLQRLVAHLQMQGNDEQAGQAARAILRYFDTAGQHHHQDEEQDLFPALLASGDPSAAAYIERLLGEHTQMNNAWRALRPLLRAIVSREPTVLLIDEVDKSDTEFEAFLLELLSDFQISVPEIGTLKANHRPFVVLTSNNSREMSDALKRRCLHLYLDYPDPQRELEIVKLKVPGVGEKLVEEVVRLLQRLRKLDLKKKPSISETLDWVRALTLLNIARLDQPLVEETLSTLLKYEGDIRKAQKEMQEYLAERKAKLPAPILETDKDLLH